VSEQGEFRSYPKQVWFVGVMVLLLLGLFLSIVLGLAPGSSKKTLARARTATFTPSLRASNTPLPTATFIPTKTLPPTESPTSKPTATKVSPSRTPTPSLPTATPLPSPTTPLRQDHYWLERPISPEGHNRVARFYPYASRGDGSYPIHHGVEFVNPMGTPILATASGTIVVAGDDLHQVYGARDNFYGLLVIEELDRRLDGNPIYVLYGHLSRVKVQVGQKVKTGEVIGLVGMSGVAEGPHLHMEVRYGKNDYASTVNPELWVRPLEGRGTLAGLVVSTEGKPIPEAKIVLYRADAPDKPVWTILSYPDREVNPDPVWGENFAIGDLQAGDWLVKVYHKQRLYSHKVTISSGKTSWITIQVAS